MAYRQDDFSFEQKTRNGSNTHWIGVLIALRYAPLSKRELLHRVWGYTDEDLRSHYVYNRNLHQWVEGVGEDLIRGRQSHLFGCMRGANLIDYNSHTRKWNITEEGKRKLYYGTR